MTNMKFELVKEQVDLRQYNWFGVGGLARYFSEPKTLGELTEVISWAKKQSLVIRLLGQGANVLISDSGFNGLIIKLDNLNEKYTVKINIKYFMNLR